MSEIPICQPRSGLRNEISAFAGVGALAFLLQIGVLNLLMIWGWGPLTANATAVTASMTVAFLGNRYVSFADRASGPIHRQIVAFVVVNILSLVLAQLLIWIAYPLGVEHDGAAVNVLNLAGMGAGMVLRFFCYRRFVFAYQASPVREP
jgi:putative flippase GtrA